MFTLLSAKCMFRGAFSFGVLIASHKADVNFRSL
jgi:hypothetical protein